MRLSQKTIGPYLGAQQKAAVKNNIDRASECPGFFQPIKMDIFLARNNSGQNLSSLLNSFT